MIRNVALYVNKLGGEATCWPEYTSCHTVLRRSRLFCIAKLMSLVDYGPILLASLGMLDPSPGPPVIGKINGQTSNVGPLERNGHGNSLRPVVPH